MAEQTEHIPAPTPRPRSTICPYCGARTRNLSRCESCRGLFDPLSRQATQNAMGPWLIRDDSRPHRPGCSYETLVRMVERGQIGPDTVLRGPSTLQFWTIARWCPGVAHLLGACHSCGQRAEPTDPACARCGASFRVSTDRQLLGLGEIRFVPGRPGEGYRGDPVTPQETGVSGAPSGEGEALADDPVIAAKLGRLGREVSAARRWGLVWLAGFILAALALGAVLLIPSLDLETGPLGRWLGREAAPPGDVLPPDLGGVAPSVVPEQPEDELSAPSGPDGRVQTPAQPDTKPAVSRGAEARPPEGAEQPEVVEMGTPAYRRLRQLR